MKLFLIMLVFAVALPALPQTSQRKQASPADRMAQKLAYLQANGAKQKPDAAPTVLTEEEINAYFAERRMKMPSGVKSLSYKGAPGKITAQTKVDFDEIRAGRGSGNPLLSIFSGVHDVTAQANARGQGGIANVDIQTVSLDGVEIPHFVLQLFIDKFIKPKYPNIGLETQFKMPSRVDSAVIDTGKVTLIQK